MPRRVFATVCITVAALLIFVCDVLTPLGVVVWILYVAPIRFAAMLPSRNHAPSYIAATVCTGFLFAGGVLSPPGIAPWVAWLNRALGGLVLFGAATVFSRARLREQELAQSRELLQLFVAHAPAAIAMFDRGMRYIVASQRWLLDYGLDGDSIIGKSHYAIFPEIPDRWREIHRRCLQGAVETHNEDRFKRRDGSSQWIRWEV